MSDIASAVVSGEIAAHVLWHFGGAAGYEPGTFVARLIEAIAAADPANQRRLERAFPGYVTAVQLAAHAPSGLAYLERIALGAL